MGYLFIHSTLCKSLYPILTYATLPHFLYSSHQINHHKKWNKWVPYCRGTFYTTRPLLYTTYSYSHPTYALHSGLPFSMIFHHFDDFLVLLMIFWHFWWFFCCKKWQFFDFFVIFLIFINFFKFFTIIV